jgi:hypothetical protein
MPYQKVTFLEDLPDVNDFETTRDYGENNHSMQSAHPQRPNINTQTRFIRKSAQPMYPESGMVNIPSSNMILDPAEEHEEPVTHSNNHPQTVASEILEPFTPSCQINCQDVYFHIDSCPVCKKFYKQDNTLYLVIIAVLLLICALLLKKILYP